MTITAKFGGGALSLLGVIALSTLAFGEGGSSGSGGGGKQDVQTFQQQRSDKTQQGQDLINKQPMAPQRSESRNDKQSGNTGADLTGGRDSHLGPHDAQETQTQRKDKKMDGSGTAR
ncbi:hypothetical protein [Nitrospira sp. Nam74]